MIFALRAKNFESFVGNDFTIYPFSFEELVALSAVKGSVSLLLVFKPIALVYVFILEKYYAASVFLVVFELAYITVSVRTY